MSYDICQRFKTTAEMLCQKLLSYGVEMQPILRACEAVSFIRVENVLHGFTGLSHGVYNLLTFRLLHSGVIGTLSNQKRFLNVIAIEERRSRFQKILFLL